ncbi:MAG: GDSL-type esterase/lipase family protein [Clostridium sp.]|nr:GDSL-type esterase/lipase family protein [Clostridium sp.]
MKAKDNKPRPFLIIFTAIAIVALLSLVPWSRLTGGFIKDYNLLADLFPAVQTAVASNSGAEVLDPEYLKAVEEMKQEMPEAEHAPADTVVLPIYHEHKETPSPEARVDGQMVIEDYTANGDGLEKVRKALASGNARIAVMGDSYIEGDILTQDMRSQLQSKYGGRGVGFVPGHSVASGFRRTIKQKDEGLTTHGMQQAPSSKYFNITGEYFTADGPAKVSYKSGKKWDVSRLLYVAPSEGSITFRTDTAEYVLEVEPGEGVQQYRLPERTGAFEMEIDCPGLVYLGAWLEGEGGIGVDCMSVRGNSGVNNRRLNVEFAQQMRQYVDYDLVILEYGVNALTSEQAEYGYFSKILQQMVDRVRQCYPNAEILIMGIGDRGQKFQGEVHSMLTAPAMVKAQRQAAKEAGCLFFDTREAMGGQDAIVKWKNDGLANSDYIHINSAGGKKIATELVNALERK